MKIAQYTYANKQWSELLIQEGFCRQTTQLVLVFGERSIIADPATYLYIYKLFPQADIVMSSTVGEIYNKAVHNNTVIVTAINFDKTSVKAEVTHIKQHEGSYEAGSRLMKKLGSEELNFILVFSDGDNLNGDELVKGLNEFNVKSVPIAGTVSGGVGHVYKAVINLNDIPSEGNIVAIGFYGNALLVSNDIKGVTDPDLVLLISAAEGKLLSPVKAYNEIGAATSKLNYSTAVAGFYAYGAISSFNRAYPSEFNNKTVIVTSLTEKNSY